MLTLAEALSAVLEHAQALPPAGLPLVDALGCVLAENAIADVDSPPFDKALVDGYAVRSSDLQGTDRLACPGRDHHWRARCLSRRWASRGGRIMTGAPVPPECDAVVMHERTRATRYGRLVLEPEIRSGQNVLVRGREMRAGEIVDRAGLDPRGRARLGYSRRSAVTRSRSSRDPWWRSCPPAMNWSSHARCPVRARSAIRTPRTSGPGDRGRRRPNIFPIAPDLAGPLRHDS